MVEEWRPIESSPGYEVSDLGRVRSYRDRQGHPSAEPRIMVLQATIHGYLWIKLGRQRQAAVHRLVADAFLGPRPPGMECRHLDGDRSNAALGNLAYGTRSENYQDRKRHGTENDGERHGLSRLTNQMAREIRASIAPTKELAHRYEVSPVTINRVRSHRSYRTA